ncbi:unnamed protein product [Lupinus luteus]|uniref:RNase H type-1 domain-containing protein n=1 Tax=Lupinus luteus TaxID=3873 RepID=A0AAV1YAM7_LUPLU
MTMWWNWRSRNNMVLDSTPWTLQEFFRKFSTNYADEERYGLASSRMTLDRASPWLSPPADWTKLNTDGGLTSPTSMSSATLKGLNLACSKCFRKVICELDCLEVVEALNNRDVIHLH